MMVERTRQAVILIHSTDASSLREMLADQPHAVHMIDADQPLQDTLAELPFVALLILDETTLKQIELATVACPVLVLVDENKQIDAAIAAGATDCMPRPLHQRLFLQRINNLIDMHTLYRYDNVPVMVHSIDKASNFRYINHRWAEVLGYEREALIGRKITEFMTPHSRQIFRDNVRRFWQMGDVRNVEYDFRHRAGHIVHIAFDAEVLRGTLGESESLAFGRDVSARKQAEEHLQRSERWMQAVLNAMSDGVLIINRSATIVRVATPNNSTLMLQPDELTGKTIHELFPQNHADEFYALINDVLATNTNRSIEYDMHSSGTQQWFNAVVSPLDDDHVVWVTRDITSNKRTHAALNETESQYRHLFDSANDAILLVDAESHAIIKANNQAALLLGHASAGTLIGRTLQEIEVGSDTNETACTVGEALSSNQNLIMQTRYQRQDGSIVDVEVSTRIITYNGNLTMLSYVRDITERKRMLRAEQEEREFAEALRDAAAAFNGLTKLDDVLDATLTYTKRIVPNQYCNIMLIEQGIASIVRWHGYEDTPVEIAALESVEFKVDDTPNMVIMRDEQRAYVIDDTRNPHWEWSSSPVSDHWLRSHVAAPIIIKGETIGFVNLDSPQTQRFNKRDGERLLAFANQAAIAIENARLFERVQAYANELEGRVQARTAELTQANAALREQIVQRQKIEDKLQEERTLLQTLIENIPDQIYVKDTQYRYMLVNHPEEQLMGRQLSAEQIIGKTDYDLLPTPTRADFSRNEEEHLLKTGEPVLNQEHTYIDTQARLRWQLYSKIPLRDAQGNIIAIIGVNRDITQLKRTQKELADERNLLRTLIDTIPDMIYIKDHRGRFTLVNEAMRQALNVEHFEDVIGKTDAEILPAPEARAYMAEDRSVMQRDVGIQNVEGELHRADGQVRNLLMSKIPLRRPGNTIITGMIGINRDITDLQQAQAQLEQVLESARCLLWSATVQRTQEGFTVERQIANEDAAQRFLPLDTRTQSYTKAWEASILREDWQRRERIKYEHIEDNLPSYSHEFRCKLPDGSVRWLVEDVQIHAVDANTWSLVGVVTDITGRKYAEQSLKALNDELETRVNERTRELVQANSVLMQEIAERKRAELAEREQRKLLQALHASSAALNRSLERAIVFDHLIDAMRNIVTHDAAHIAIIEPDDATFYFVRQRGYKTSLPEDLQRINDFSALQQVMDSGDAVIIGGADSDDNWLKIESEAWLRSSITVPIPLEGVVIGFLTLHSASQKAFTDEHAAYLFGFVNQAAIAIRNARLLEEMRADAARLDKRVQERTVELDQERAQLKAILNAIRDGVVYTNHENQPLYHNQALVDMTGYTSEEWLEGMALRRIFPQSDEEQRQIWARAARHLEKAGYWENELKVINAEGRMFDAALTRTRVRDADDQEIGTLTVVRDISQAKALEEQKKRFIASASHELRTPIANMKTRLFLIRRKPEKLEENIAIIESVVNWMQQLVEDMFDLSRFERGVIQLKPETVVLQDLITEVVRFQELEAERQDIKLLADVPEQPIYAEVDPYRIMQVLTNLLSNALRYTGEDGQIMLLLRLLSDEVIMRVSDTGVGIDAAHLPELFKPFFRATEDNRGAGLGLAITQEIVRSHGGSISVQSKKGEGTTFTISLPRSILRDAE